LTAATTEAATSQVAIEGCRDAFRGAAIAGTSFSRLREKVPEADEGQ